MKVLKRRCVWSALLLIPAEGYMKAKLLIAAVLVAILAASTSANWAPGDAPFINTWLVLGLSLIHI